MTSGVAAFGPAKITSYGNSDSATALSLSASTGATSFADEMLGLLSDSTPPSQPTSAGTGDSQTFESSTRTFGASPLPVIPTRSVKVSGQNTADLPKQKPAPVREQPPSDRASGLTTLPLPAPSAVPPATALPPIVPPSVTTASRAITASLAAAPLSPPCESAPPSENSASQTTGIAFPIVSAAVEPVFRVLTPPTPSFAPPMNSSPATGSTTEDSPSKNPVLAFAARLTEGTSLETSHATSSPLFPVRTDWLAPQARNLPVTTPAPSASPNPNAQISSKITSPALLAPPAIAVSKPVATDPQPAEFTADPKVPDPKETQPAPANSQPQAEARASTDTEAKPAAHLEGPDAQQAPIPAISLVASAVMKPAIETAAPFEATAPKASLESLPEAHPAPLLSSARDDTDAVASQPIREVSIRITNEVSQTADVRMVERNGEIQVAVRSSDPILANSLRSDLGDLVRNLSPTGLSAEVWHPGITPQTGASSDARQEDARGGPFSQQRNGQDFQQSGGQQRHGGRQQPPPWLEELESIPGGSQTRRKNA